MNVDSNADGRSPFEDDWAKDYEVFAPDGERRYYEKSLLKLILKLWRDVALTAIDMGGKANEKLVAQMVGAASKTKKQKGYYRNRASFTLSEVVKPVGGETLFVAVPYPLTSLMQILLLRTREETSGMTSGTLRK